MFIHEIQRVERFLCSAGKTKLYQSFALKILFFVNGSFPTLSPDHPPCDGASVFRYACKRISKRYIVFCISLSWLDLSTPCECIVWICVYLRFIFLLLSEISVRFQARDGIKKYLLCLDFAPHKSNASAKESCCSFWAAKKDRQRVSARGSWLQYTL